MNFPDKRRHPRLPVLIDCRVEGTSARAQMRMTDLSPVGCYIDTSIAFPADTRVTVFVTIGGSEVPLSGRVIPMKQSGFGFGVEFTDLSDDAREKLETYIRELASS